MGCLFDFVGVETCMFACNRFANVLPTTPPKCTWHPNLAKLVAIKAALPPILILPAGSFLAELTTVSNTVAEFWPDISRSAAPPRENQYPSDSCKEVNEGMFSWSLMVSKDSCRSAETWEALTRRSMHVFHPKTSVLSHVDLSTKWLCNVVKR